MNQYHKSAPKTVRQILVESLPYNKKLTLTEIQAILPARIKPTTLLRVIRKLREDGKIKKTVNLKNLRKPHYERIGIRILKEE